MAAPPATPTPAAPPAVTAPGQVRTAVVHRRLWDGPARAQAERLAQTWPSWTILYGVGSRRFYALAAWTAPEPLMVDAATAATAKPKSSHSWQTAPTNATSNEPPPGKSPPTPDGS